MSAKKLFYILAGVFVVVIVAVVVALFSVRKNIEMSGSAGFKTYTSSTIGIAFDYPNTYTLKEITPDATGAHQAMVLTDTEVLESVSSHPEIDTEGPVTITIDIYSNNIENKSLLEWVQNSPQSNFNQIVGSIATTTLSGRQALSYTWDGLYRGDSLVFPHNANIVMMTVTYMAPSEQIRRDFSSVVSSLRLSDAPKVSSQAQVISYLKAHISELSPIKESVGGKFFLTQAQFGADTTGQVSYEDGHNFYTASFTYSVDSQGSVRVTDFKIIDQKG